MVKNSIIPIIVNSLKFALNNCDGRIDQTYIVQRKAVGLELNLEKGSYIAIPCTKTKGDCAKFYLEFYFEDELLKNTENNEFKFDQLKYTRIKKLNGPTRCELINEYIASEVKLTSKNKLDFIIYAFQYSLKSDENKDKKQKSKSHNFNQSVEDEDIDYI